MQPPQGEVLPEKEREDDDDRQFEDITDGDRA